MMVMTGMRNQVQAYFPLLPPFSADMPLLAADDTFWGICQLDATKTPAVSDALMSKTPFNALMGFKPPGNGGIVGIDGVLGGADEAHGCCGGICCA